ncbi:hypothetical protein NKH77_26560 [Streptomyces sp. M19]
MPEPMDDPGRTPVRATVSRPRGSVAAKADRLATTPRSTSAATRAAAGRAAVSSAYRRRTSTPSSPCSAA